MKEGPENERFQKLIEAEGGMVISLRLRLTKEQIDQFRLLIKPIPQEKDSVVAVRSVDILELLRDFSEGTIQVNKPRNEVLMSRGKYFYMTAVLSHPFYKKHTELGLYDPTRGISTIYENAQEYGENAARFGAFARVIMPLLQGDWRREAVKYHKSIWGEVEHPETALLRDNVPIEAFVEDVFKNIVLMHSEIFSYKRALSTNNEWKFPALQKLVQMTRGIDPEALIDYLSHVCEVRSGVIVGFNENVFQGDLFSRYHGPINDRRAAHGENEVLVKARSIKLFPKGNPIISAVETLGEYEDAVLQELGITSYNQ